jgi:anhydro-N-acetylmuramic acid kinase
MKELFIGLMSGTSMDAVDAALVDFHTKPLQLIASHSKNLPTQLRSDLISLCTPDNNEINRLGELDVQVGALFAETANELIKKANILTEQIIAIGSHGQTIRHQPYGKFPFTLQIGDPNIIAAKTGITTIADFRRRDMAMGGQGAPLAPTFHNYVFRKAGVDRIILNLGGIANITHLPADLTHPVIGFDTGPANTLLDAWAYKHLSKQFDAEGRWAASGKINQELLALLLSDPYFTKNPPKSTGREYFNLTWLEQYLNKLAINLTPADIQTTLCELTAKSIADAIYALCPTGCDIYICGGGLKNNYLLTRLKINCTSCNLQATEDLGVPAQWLEAMLMAWLAWQTFNKNPGNLPSVTGASKEVILGGTYFAGSR